MSTEFKSEKRESITGSWVNVPNGVLLHVWNSSPFYYLTVVERSTGLITIAYGFRERGITDHDYVEVEPGVDPRQLAAEILTAFRKRAAEHWERTMAAGKPSAWR